MHFLVKDSSISERLMDVPSFRPWYVVEPWVGHRTAKVVARKKWILGRKSSSKIGFRQKADFCAGDPARTLRCRELKLLWWVVSVEMCLCANFQPPISFLSRDISKESWTKSWFFQNGAVHRTPTIQLMELKFVLQVELDQVLTYKKFQLERLMLRWFSKVSKSAPRKNDFWAIFRCFQ